MFDDMVGDQKPIVALIILILLVVCAAIGLGFAVYSALLTLGVFS